MPIENERKFILDHTSDELISFLVDKRFFNIEQHYLNENTRVRKISNRITKDEYFFTFKTIVDDELIEIEQPIGKKDYEKLKKVSISSISKLRFNYRHGSKKWEIDLFKNETNNIEKIVAEIELPEGQDLPKNIPHIIQNNLIKLVDKNDASESNYSMSLK